MITDYHAKYYAYDLLRSSTDDGIEKISRSLFDAAVDLNPHQIEAALFALKSPLSKGREVWEVWEVWDVVNFINFRVEKREEGLIK